MSTQVLNIPDLGEAEDVEVIEICVKPGEILPSRILGRFNEYSSIKHTRFRRS